MKSVSMSCHIMSCPVLLEAIWKQKLFYPTPLFMLCHTELLHKWFCQHTCKQNILSVSLSSLHCYLQLQTAAMASVPFCCLSARRDLFSGVSFSLSVCCHGSKTKTRPKMEKNVKGIKTDARGKLRVLPWLLEIPIKWYIFWMESYSCRTVLFSLLPYSYKLLLTSMSICFASVKF